MSGLWDSVPRRGGVARQLCSVATVAAAFWAALPGCGDDAVSTRRAESGLHPDAGPDQTVLVGEEVTLDGSASRGTGGALLYQWESLSARIRLDSRTTPLARFTPADAGVYPFLLWVSSPAYTDTWVSGHVVVTVRLSDGPPSGLGSMVRVAAGYTVVGTAVAAVPDARFESEAPGAVVSLHAFEIDRYEVTNQEYRAFVQANPRRHEFDALPGFSDPLQPVVGITWDDAQAYCASQGKRLPSELEWERAARGFDARGAEAALTPIVERYRAAFAAAANRTGLRDSGAGDTFTADVLAMLDGVVADASAQAVYPWGFAYPDAAQANFGGDIAGNVRHTVEAGSYPLGRSPAGAYEMAGNVREWTADWFDAGLFAGQRKELERRLADVVKKVEAGKQSNAFPALSLADIAAADPSPTVPKDTNLAARAVRGGSWIDGALAIRAARRGAAPPAVRTSHTGFRCAR